MRPTTPPLQSSSSPPARTPACGLFVPARACKAIHLRLATVYWIAYTRILFWLNGVKCGSLKAPSRARINVSLGGKASIPAGEIWGGNPATKIQ